MGDSQSLERLTPNFSMSGSITNKRLQSKLTVIQA